MGQITFAKLYIGSPGYINDAEFLYCTVRATDYSLHNEATPGHLLVLLGTLQTAMTYRHGWPIFGVGASVVGGFSDVVVSGPQLLSSPP